MPSEFTWPVDDEGYRACQVCMQSVKESLWVQIPKIQMNANGKIATREWLTSENECPRSIGGPVLHLTCVETYLTGLHFEFTEAIKRGAGD